jgi:hypothetical protein
MRVDFPSSTEPHVRNRRGLASPTGGALDADAIPVPAAAAPVPAFVPGFTEVLAIRNTPPASSSPSKQPHRYR